MSKKQDYQDKIIKNNMVEVDKSTGEVLYPLLDVSPITGKTKPWKNKKIKNVELANIYYDLSQHKDDYYYKKAEKLLACGNELYYNIDTNGLMTLAKANSCHVKLCPICSWRRSRKLQAQLTTVISEVAKNEKYKFIFLTLTIPNCTGEQLTITLNQMMRGWTNLTKRKKWKDNIIGWYRVLEITHNLNPKSKSYNTYHPHFHCLLVVDKKYCDKSNSNYIKQSEWLEMWQQVMHNDTITQVNIKTVKNDGNINHALLELAKYSVKDSDYIVPYDWQLSKETVAILDTALHRRRLVAFGGILKNIHKQLNLDDPIDGDLVHIDDNATSDNDKQAMLCFFWHYGYQQYYLR